ncbi:hypothetical protein ACHAXT_008272 [Thalassiosira profunda]
MGGICSVCGGEEEAKQPGAFADASASDVQSSSHHSQPPAAYPPYDTQSPNASSHPVDPNPSPHSSTHGSGHPLDQDQTEEERQLRLEQFRLEQAELARREAIVNVASQSMVPVGAPGGGHAMDRHNPHHRAGGVNTYYDPAYAAAAAQDILRSAAMTGGLVFQDDPATRAAWKANVMGTMPTPASTNSKDAFDALGTGRWEGVRLGSRGSGLAGCGGEDPQYYLDDLSEAFLEAMVPTRTSLFGGCASIVENLP